MMDLLSRFLENEGADADIRWGEIQVRTKLRMPKLNFEGVVSEAEKVPSLPRRTTTS